MNKTGLMLGSAALALSVALGTVPALAQDIDFGDNSSTWAHDGQCDDPRFEGPGAATFRSPVDLLRDAADCEAAYEAGEVTYIGAHEDDGADDNDADDDADATPPAQDTGIDFGDDSGMFANDGDCDDPRFGGALESHRLADATDCRTAYEAGEVTYSEADGDTGADTGEIDFGDDSGFFANDGECDDPRFGGGLESHRLADATDCREAYEAGEVTYSGDEGVDTGPSPAGDIDFGDDSGTFANDGECDDPRFGGGLESHRLADATDCREAYEAGEVTYIEDADAEPVDYPIVIDGIDFGDDSGNWARDGECDDPRFEGPGTGVALDDHLRADATDCAEGYQAGTVSLIEEGSEDADNGERPVPGFRINFGDDSSDTAFDGICDDPRFQGRGAAMELLDDNILADATDCRAAYDAGTVTYNP